MLSKMNCCWLGKNDTYTLDEAGDRCPVMTAFKLVFRESSGSASVPASCELQQLTTSPYHSTFSARSGPPLNSACAPVCYITLKARNPSGRYLKHLLPAKPPVSVFVSWVHTLHCSSMCSAICLWWSFDCFNPSGEKASYRFSKLPIYLSWVNRPGQTVYSPPDKLGSWLK